MTAHSPGRPSFVQRLRFPGVLLGAALTIASPSGYNSAYAQAEAPAEAEAADDLIELGLPPEVDWGPAGGDGSHPPHVTITNDGNEAIRLIYAVAESPGITAQVPREPIEPGQLIDVPIIVQPNRWNGQATRIRIPTTCAEQPDLFIYVAPRKP